MMTSELMTQGAELFPTFGTRGEARRVDPRSCEDGRLRLLRATSELRPSYPLYPTTIATKDAIQPSYRIASVRGLWPTCWD